MAHKAYEKGAAFERRVQKYFEDLGYKVVRAAGSHSPVDLVCGKIGERILVQCRIGGNLTKWEEKILIEWGKEYEARVLLAYKKDRKVEFRNI